MEATVFDASSAAATAALSRRRKQSRPRQLASSVDSEASADNQQAADVVDTLRCSNCRDTFAHVDELVEHSARPCGNSEVDGGRCSSEVGHVDDRLVCAPDVDDGGVESRMKTSVEDSVEDDADHDVDAEFDTATDDFTQPQLPPSSVQGPSPFFDGDNDHDDEHLDAPDDYVLPNISSNQSAGHFDKVYAPDVDEPVTGFRRLPTEEDHLVNVGGPSPKTSGSTMTNVSQLIDNNVSPASKIAMLESVVYALHQQQMFQLELIEALRRQLATALAASASSLTSRPGDDAGNATLDLTLPRSSETTVVDQGSSLSSLMRLSAGVDARRAPAGGVHSPTTSPTTLSGSMLDSHDAAVQAELAVNKSRIPTASALSTPKHVPPLSDLSLFKKGKPPNVTVIRSSDSAAEIGGEDSSSSIFKHRCRLCLKILGSDSALQIHMRSHTGERPYKCNICGNRFTTKGNLKVHFQRHLEQYPNARMNPDPVPEYLDHQDASHGYDRHMAPPAHTVSAAVKSAMPSFRHSTTPNNKPFVEQTARSMSTSDDSSLMSARENFVPKSSASELMKAESSLIHQQRRVTDSSSMSTADGDTQFQSPLSALSSMSSALSAFAPQIRMTFPPPPPPSISTTPLPVPPGPPVFAPFNMDSVAPTLPPPVPPSTELDDEDLEQYMEIQQTDTARIEELMRDATVEGGRPRDGSTPSDPNECVICHRVLSCRSALLMHYRTHTGERPYRCRLCGRTFTTKGNLKTHMAVHRGRISGQAAASGQHRCRICRRDFLGSVALQQHIRSAHAPDMTPASNSQFPFPATGAGDSAAATAAAMMMMPGVNPLLPFFNFSPFYQAPRNLLPSALNSTAPAPVRSAIQDRDDSGGRELDLRKSLHVDRDTRDGVSRPDVNGHGADGGPASKRVKTEDGDAGADGDAVGRWQNGADASRHLNSRCGSSSNEYAGFSPGTNDDESNYNEPTLSGDGPTMSTAADSKYSFSVNKDLSTIDVSGDDDDARMNDNCQPPVIQEEEPHPVIATERDENLDKFSDHIASKFVSPLLALEERVNSLDYSTNMLSRFSVAAANAVHRDVPAGSVDDDCDVEDRSSSIQDLRTHDYRLSHVEGDDSRHREDQQSVSMSTSPSARRLVIPGQSDGDVVSDDSASSRNSTSPGAIVRPGSSGSGASSSLSGGAVLPALDRSDVGSAVQSPSKMSASTPTRFSCPVCAKPFSSASALEIHSRTHSGDRPFVCRVCSKAFTTKGNLKVHMSTHAWNKCPSRRGRRMTVVDPAAAAAVAAASGAFSCSMSAPKDAATAAATAAFLSSTFGSGMRFDGALPPPPPMFGGFVPTPPGVAGNGAFLSDNKALLNYCMQAAAAHGAGRDSLASDTIRQTMSTAGIGGDWSGGSSPWIVGAGSFKDERNNNGRTTGGTLPAQRGGELDLSARSNGSNVGVAASNFADRQTSPGMRSWTSDRASSLPLISNCT